MTALKIALQRGTSPAASAKECCVSNSRNCTSPVCPATYQFIDCQRRSAIRGSLSGQWVSFGLFVARRTHPNYCLDRSANRLQSVTQKMWREAANGVQFNDLSDTALRPHQHDIGAACRNCSRPQADASGRKHCVAGAGTHPPYPNHCSPLTQPLQNRHRPPRAAASCSGDPVFGHG